MTSKIVKNGLDLGSTLTLLGGLIILAGIVILFNSDVNNKEINAVDYGYVKELVEKQMVPRALLLESLSDNKISIKEYQKICKASKQSVKRSLMDISKD